MKKNIRRFLLILIVFIAICVLNENKVKAASATVSGNQTVTAGQTVTVTATVTAGAWNVTLSGGGESSSLVGQTSIAGNQTVTTSITFVANQNTTVTLTGDITDFSADTSQPVSDSMQVTVQAASSGQTPSTGDNGNSGGNSSSNSGGNSSSNTGGSTTNNGGNSSGNSTNKSSDANLTNLGIRPNDFTGFIPNQTSYSVDVPNDVTTIEVYAEWKNGQTVSGIGTKSLKEGANTFNVVVTAADGVTTKTYTVTVNRETAEDSENETDETQQEDENSENTEIVNGNSVFGLSKLQINGIELDPEFSTEVYEYTAKLIGDKESVEISTEATEDNANVEITGNEALKEGENIITILVTNEAGDKTAAYQIKLTKSLVDEEALAREKELEQEQKNRRILLIACAVVFILVVVIILIWRHRRNKRLAEEYSIPYQGFNDDDEYDDYDNNFNKQDENTYEKISDKFDEDDEWYNRDLSKQDETTDEEQISENEQVKIDYNQQMEDEYEEDENSRESLREQYLNQSFDNDIDFDNKSKKRHSKGKRFK